MQLLRLPVPRLLPWTQQSLHRRRRLLQWLLPLQLQPRLQLPVRNCRWRSRRLAKRARAGVLQAKEAVRLPSKRHSRVPWVG